MAETDQGLFQKEISLNIMLSRRQQIIKRMFDLSLGTIVWVVCSPLLIMCYFVGLLKFSGRPLFKTIRIGQFGKRFWLYKFRTYDGNGHITEIDKINISKYGRFLQKTKINELPQVFQVIIGQMSLVGPRPDEPGFADRLNGEESLIVQLKPGITGPATLKYKNENQILELEENPMKYNQEVIWPDKVNINLNYLKNWSIKLDCYYILRTII